jgi:hypothetical protein
MTTETTQRADATPAADAAPDTETPPPRDMSPAAALGRHLEWLEHALVVAREEEARRQGRLDRAKDKNRDKRTARLAEVTDEVAELEALVAGIKELQARAGSIGGAAAPRRKAISPKPTA